jgi:putative transposase
MERKGVSQRRALGYVGMSRSVLNYRGVNVEVRDGGLQKAIEGLCTQYPRMGLPMLVNRLRQQGYTDNHKRIARLYTASGWSLKKRSTKRVKREARGLVRPNQTNHTWSMDFVHDRYGVLHQHGLKCLTIVDDATDEAVAILAQPRNQSSDVVYTLELLACTRGLPQYLRSDNGKEFTSRRLAAWALQHGVELLFIQPGKPNQNAFVESFNSRFRQECLNLHQFTSLPQAQQTIEAWRQEFNYKRPKKRLAGLTPYQYAQQLQQTTTVMYNHPRILDPTETNFGV